MKKGPGIWRWGNPGGGGREPMIRRAILSLILGCCATKNQEAGVNKNEAFKALLNSRFLSNHYGCKSS
jgi:hypothetical protein